MNEKRKLINKCAYFLIKKLVMFLSFSVIFPSYTDKCLVLMNSIIIPLTSVFYFVFSSYTNKCLVIRISGIVIPKSLIQKKIIWFLSKNFKFLFFMHIIFEKKSNCFSILNWNQTSNKDIKNNLHFCEKANTTIRKSGL